MVKNKWFLIVSIALVVVLVCSAGLIKNASAENNPTEHPTEGMLFDSQVAQRFETASGTCGQDLRWSLDADGMMIIEGTGTMDDYDSVDAPWNACTAFVRKLVIKSGVNGIGSHGFDACTELSEVVFEGDAPAFGADAFAGVTATVFYPGDNNTWTSDVMQSYGGSITWTTEG